MALDEQTSQFPKACQETALSPFTPGRVRCKCVIWNTCPIYERVKQEFILQFTPETLAHLSDYQRANLATLPNNDGVFLKPVDNFYLDTYLCEFNGSNIGEYVDYVNLTKAMTDGKSWVHFLGKKNAGDRNYQIPPVLKLPNYTFLNNYYLTLGSTHLGVSNGKVIYGNAIGSHQTFVVHHSIYDDQTLRFSDYYRRYQKLPNFRDIAIYFRPQWGYKLIRTGSSKNILSNVVVTPGALPNSLQASAFAGSLVDDSRFLAPVLLGIDGAGDPIRLAASANALVDGVGKIDPNKVNTVAFINPGLHWGLAKRLMLAPGTGFSLSFISQTPDSFKIADPKQRYSMLPSFAWLDPLRKNRVSDCAGYDTQGNYSKDQFLAAQEEQRRIYNLANQVYILVQLPLDTTPEIYGNKRQELFLLIAENMPPTIFRTEGYKPVCRSKSGQTQVSSDCGFQTVQQTNGTTNASYLWDSGAIPISTCDFASSPDLLSREHLKINFRVHAGKLIITFGGFERNYWIVSNSIVKPPVANADVAVSNTTTKTYPFKFTLSTIFIYGGNKKYAFNYTPIIYENAAPFEMQPLSVQGPTEYDEIEFLLREKKNPNSNLRDANYLYPYFEKNYATAYIEKAFDNNPKYQTSCNLANAFNLDDEEKKKKTEENAQGGQDTIYAKTKYLERHNFYAPNQDAYVLKFGRKTELRIFPTNCFEATNTPADGTSTDRYLKYANRRVKLSIRLQAGDILMPDIDNFGEDYWLQNADTPILSNVRVNLHEKGCAWVKDPVDVSNYVLTFNDEWSETDFQKISHTGSISFLTKNANNAYDAWYSNFLYNLADKTFYLQISLYWDNYLGKTDAEWENLDTDRIVFTGLCHGGQYTIENNKEVLNCTLYDYSKILQDQVFFNSPFYDRMTDVFAIHEILSMAGFRDGSDNGSTYEPNSFLRMIVDNYDRLKNNSVMNFLFNGEKYKLRNFVLPGSYDILQQPMFKFPDDSPLWSAVEKLAMVSSKIAYFDRFGVFKFENMPFDNAIFSLQNSVTQDISEREQEAINSIYERAKKNCYVTSHRENAEYADKKEKDKEKGVAVSKTQINCQPGFYDKAILLAIQSYTWDRAVGDVKNEIRVITATPNGELLIAGDVNYRSLYDPDTEGFIGYKKVFIQMDGIFGSEETVKQMVTHYTKMYIPYLKVSFKAVGRNKLKALDPITFQGLGLTNDQKQALIITSIRNEVDAANNTWYQNIEAIWLFSGKNVQYGKTNTIGIGLDGSVSNQ